MSKNKKAATQTGELFKQTMPKMPEGYYSGDKPNPNLRTFVEQHLKERPYDPATDNYDVPAFDKPIETTKATAIYNMHTYWSKKPHDAIRQYIQHYTQPGDLVLDPFSGSGGTALAALMEGRKAVAIDRSPAATFITKNYCTPVDVAALKEAFEKLKADTRDEIDWLYETRCHLTDKPAAIAYTVYSQVFQCPRCLEKVPLFDCIEAEGTTGKGKPKKINICPHCHKKNVVEEIRSQSQKYGYVPVLVSYAVPESGRAKRVERQHDDPNPKARAYFQQYDVGRLQEIAARPVPYWFPKGYDMRGFSRYQRDALRLYGVNEVADLFTKRNLWAISVLRHHIQKFGVHSDALMFTLTSILLKSSRMMAHNSDGIGRIQKGTYYIPQTEHDVHVGKFMEEAFDDMVRGYEELRGFGTNVFISTEDAQRLNLPDNSVDYIFTDPPYGGTVQYGELNFAWEAWLGCDTSWHEAEIVVNEQRNKGEGDWAGRMKNALSQAARVLKPGRTMSICYHDTSDGTWELLQDLTAEAGLVPEDTETTLYIESKMKTTNQYFAEKVNKRDLVINFRKPKPGEHRSKVVITGEEDQQTFRQKAQAVIREFLQASPGSTKDRIYDDVVSRLVRKGQMEAHNFDELLREVAEEVKEPVKKNLFENEEPDLLGSHLMGRWHLKESEVGAEDAERATADSAGTRIHDFLAKTTAAKLKESETRISKLQAEIAQRRSKLQAVDQGKSDESRGKLLREIRELTETLDKLTVQRVEWERQALDYSQIFEFYVGAVNPKPKARLEEILEDYCYQTDEGNWRPPLTEPEKKEKGSERQRAVRRKMQRFCNLLEAGGAITEDQRPDTQTLAEWIGHCRRTGLHAQGKLLYERGGDLSALSEQAQVDVEEDYQVCVKHLEHGSK